MRRSRSLVLALAAIFILILDVSHASNSIAQREFRIEEYELFHDVLQPLQHEALPQGDFQRIRAMATELVTRGKAIVGLGVPEAPSASRRRFAKARKKFDMTLARLKADAKAGSDAVLKKSLVAVHDSFEQLADLVPTVYQLGMPPIVGVNCPAEKPEAGSEITLSAYTGDPDGLVFFWTISGGKILRVRVRRQLRSTPQGWLGRRFR
jgi:hypothetical protein